MNVKELLRGEFLCSCGQKHSCDIKEILVEKGALDKIPGFLAGHKNALLVSDGNTKPLCGEKVLEKLRGAGMNVTEAFFNQTSLVIPDEHSIAFVDSFVTADTDVIVGVGSGVINDLCKYVSFTHKLPYMIVATAPSMDGYASKGAAMIISGMKVTYTTHVASWIVGDTDILANAPMDMIRAGIGDILGKYASLNDWKLACLLNDEHHCQLIEDLIQGELDACAANIPACMARDPQAIGRLTESLAIMGVSIAYMGSSRPASGSEHHFSHFFEITGIIHHRDYFCHGLDVGYATVLSQRLRYWILTLDPAAFRHGRDDAAWEAEIRRVFASRAPEVLELQKQVGFYGVDRVQRIRDNWAEVCRIIRTSPTGEEVLAMLRLAGYHMDELTDMYPEAVIRDCMIYAKDLKDRYTQLWLLQDTGMLEETARKVRLN